MQLDVHEALKNAGQSYPFECAVEIPPMEVLDDPVEFVSVVVQGELLGTGEAVSVKGRASAVVRSRCCKCLEPVSQPISAPVEEVFARAPEPENPDARLLEGYFISLEDVARDALLLELPMRFQCAEHCKGLCPTCGVNRNTQRCTCQEGSNPKNPFSALSELLIKDEEV